MANHGFWHSGVRDSKNSKILTLLNFPVKRIPRGQQSREEHNEARELKEKRKPKESPAQKMERKRIWGYYTDKSGRSYTKAQVQRYVEQMKKGQVPDDAVDKDSLTYHPPESQKDVIDSLGEIHIALGKSYPALPIDEGEVLVDPKIRFVHPILK